MKVNVIMVLPLPVGRRVSVRWYRRKTRPNEPVIEDLETGVIYAFDWLYDATSGDNPNRDPLAFGEGFASGVEEERAVVGRVTGCRVFTIVDPGTSLRTQQTELTLAPEPEQPTAYR